MAKGVRKADAVRPGAGARAPVVRRMVSDDLPKPTRLNRKMSSAHDMDGLDGRSLLVWLTIADECLRDPKKAFSRVARDPEQVDDVSKFITELERLCGKQLVARSKPSNPLAVGKRRSGHLTWNGLLLADVCTCIEHLWLFFLQAEGGARTCQQLRPVKDTMFKMLGIDMRREIDRQTYGPPLAGKTIENAVQRDRVSRYRGFIPP